MIVLWIVLGEAPVSPVTILVWFVGYLRGSSSNYRRCIWLTFSKRASIDFRATLEVPCLYLLDFTDATYWQDDLLAR